MLFFDRREAGRLLARALTPFRAESPIVLGLARGGVIVAAEVAHQLGAPLDVLVARKIGAPGQAEFAIGAVAPGVTILNSPLVTRLRVPQAYIDRAVAHETGEMERRERAYRRGQPAPALGGRTVILVDDGLATGATAQAAVEAVKRQHPARVIFAAPVCDERSAAALRGRADEVVCLDYPRPFRAVSLAYDDFAPTSDAEVLACLAGAAPERTTLPAGKELS